MNKLQPEQEFLLVKRGSIETTLGKLKTSLKSSKKAYVAWTDSTVVARPIISHIAVPVEELEHLDKSYKPAYWIDLQQLLANGGVVGTMSELSDHLASSSLFAFGFLTTTEDPEVVSKNYNIDLSEYKVVEDVNHYCVLQKRF